LVTSARCFAIAVALLACNDAAPSRPTPAPAPASRCDEYMRTLREAAAAHPAPADTADVQGIDACGCAYVVHTTTALAAKVKTAFSEWTRAGCRTVNCDTPCSASMRPQ
jgi:hypothetical protein